MCWSVKWKFLQIVKFSRHAKPYIFLPDLLILMLIKPCRGCRPKHAWMQGMDTQPVACDDAVVYMYQEAAQMICPVNQIQSEERKRLYFGFYCVVYVYAHDFAKMKKKYKSSYHWIPFIHDSQMSAANSLLESNKARRTKMITS